MSLHTCNRLMSLDLVNISFVVSSLLITMPFQCKWAHMMGSAVRHAFNWASNYVFYVKVSNFVPLI